MTQDPLKKLKPKVEGRTILKVQRGRLDYHLGSAGGVLINTGDNESEGSSVLMHLSDGSVLEITASEWGHIAWRPK